MPTPLIDRQRKLHEIARIRIGEKVPVMVGDKQKLDKNSEPLFRPGMLETFRLTSVDRNMLEVAQKVFGGELAPWEGHVGQWELYTERTQLKVLIHMNYSLSEDYELWTAAGCARRCDGTICRVPAEDGFIDKPCMCPREDKEMEDLADKGKACKLTTRLNVMLTEVPALGLWRLESHGKIFNSEVFAAVQLMEQVGLGGERKTEPVYCVLTIAQQEIKKPGQPLRKFSIPKLTLDPRPTNFGALIQRSQAEALPAGDRQALGVGEPSANSAAQTSAQEESNRPDDPAGAIVYELRRKGIDPSTKEGSEAMMDWLCKDTGRAYERIEDIPPATLAKKLQGLEMWVRGEKKIGPLDDFLTNPFNESGKLAI